MALCNILPTVEELGKCTHKTTHNTLHKKSPNYILYKIKYSVDIMKMRVLKSSFKDR